MLRLRLLVQTPSASPPVRDSDPTLPEMDPHQRPADSHQRHRHRADRLQPQTLQAQQTHRPAGAGVARRVGAPGAPGRAPADHRRRDFCRSPAQAGPARATATRHRAASRPGLPAVHRVDLLRKVRQRVLSVDQQEPQGRVLHTTDAAAVRETGATPATTWPTSGKTC